MASPSEDRSSEDAIDMESKLAEIEAQNPNWTGGAAFRQLYANDPAELYHLLQLAMPDPRTRWRHVASEVELVGEEIWYEELRCCEFVRFRTTGDRYAPHRVETGRVEMKHNSITRLRQLENEATDANLRAKLEDVRAGFEQLPDELYVWWSSEPIDGKQYSHVPDEPRVLAEMRALASKAARLLAASKSIPMPRGRKPGDQVDGAKLKLLRGRFTQVDLAAKCDVSLPTIQRGEDGQSWSEETFSVVAQTLTLLLGYPVSPRDLKKHQK